MPASAETHGTIAAESHLAPDTARELRDRGFVVMQGPAIPGGPAGLSEAYDHAVATADPADIRVSSSTRVNDFVNRGPEFDGLYVYPPVLAACCRIIGRPFKLSGTRARTLKPGAPVEPLHVDVQHGADGWPIVGFILMVDPFDADNGATRFVPGSHGQTGLPGDDDEQVVACGPAGSIIIFNGSAWHGHGANRSNRRRRSVQGHFIPREARAALDHAARMRPATLQRIGSLAKYLLDVE